MIHVSCRLVDLLVRVSRVRILGESKKEVIRIAFLSFYGVETFTKFLQAKMLIWT